MKSRSAPKAHPMRESPKAMQAGARADVAVAYLNAHGDARTTRARVEAEGRNCILIARDVLGQAVCDRAEARG